MSVSDTDYYLLLRAVWGSRSAFKLLSALGFSSSFAENAFRQAMK